MLVAMAVTLLGYPVVRKEEAEGSVFVMVDKLGSTALSRVIYFISSFVP